MHSVQELVERTRRGDGAALEELWAHCEPQVTALCRRFLLGPLRDPGVDEHDLARETLLRALYRLDLYEDRSAEGADFEAWLLTVTRRYCLRFLARQRRRQQWSAPPDGDVCLAERADPAPSVERAVEEREVLRLVSKAVSTLPDQYRIVFELYLNEHSQPAIAAALGISAACAAKRVQRARRLLRPRLSELFDCGKAK